MSTSVSTNKANKMAKKTTAPATTVAPVEAAPAKTPRKNTKAETTTAPAVTPAVETAPAEVRTAETILSGLQETLRAINTEFAGRIRAVVGEAQEATRALKREARDSRKKRKVDPATLSPEDRAKQEARRANNAFLKVRPISDELASFMGLPVKSLKSQTDVTKFISSQVKSHNCFDPNFKRRIIPDAKLSKLLRVTDKDQVTYLNLQSYLKVHFLKPTA